MPGRRPKPLDGPELLDYALRTLTTRALSANEVRARLHRRAATPSDVDEVLGKLKDSGLLDDARFAESYAAARRDNQGFGKMRVLRDLQVRRVAPELAREAATEAFAEVDERELAEQYLQRKYRGKVLGAFLSEPKNLASAYRRLRVAGFGASISISVLKRYAERAGELEDSEPGSDAE